jgi:hypothetical protein
MIRAGLLLLLAGPAAAEGWSLSASVRARVETIDGQVRTTFAPSETSISTRVRFGVTYDREVWFLAAQVQDSRLLATGPDSVATTGEVNVLEPVNLHLGLRLQDLGPLEGETRVVLGRQFLQIGTRRLVASNEFRNTANSFTGVSLDHRGPEGARLQLYHVLPQRRLPDDRERLLENDFQLDRESFGLQLFGGSGELRPRGNRLTVGFLYAGLVEQDRDAVATRDRRLHTLGPRIAIPPQSGAFDLEVEGFAQFGRTSVSSLPGAAQVPVAAGFVHAEAGYRSGGRWEPRLAVQMDVATGEGPGRSFRRFDTLFGVRRVDFSPSSLYNVVGRANVIAPALRLELEPRRGTDAFMTWRGLWAESAADSFSTSGVVNRPQVAERFAGFEYQGRVRHDLVPGRMRAEFHWAFLARRGILEEGLNAPPGRSTAYVATSIETLF